MAQRGRPRKTDTRPNATTDTRTSYRCCRCGREYKSQRGNFPYNQSSLFNGNNHYSHICYTCVDELFEHYTKTLGSELAALRRICGKLDWYYSPSVFEMTDKTNVESSRCAMYASKLAIRQNHDKTYDTTLDEEHTETMTDEETVVDPKVRKFFGEGLDERDYEYLNDHYQEWTAQYECETNAQRELFKNLAFIQLNTFKAQRDGDIKRVNENMRTLQETMKTQGITPLQRNDNTLAEQNTFGTLIRKWEETRPIPEPDPEWKDVDGIVHYITIYFLGHLCKMFGFRNKYAAMYEREMAKDRVERPEFEDDDDEDTSFEKTFGSVLEDK